MDPKSTDGKPPSFEPLDPAFGAKLVDFVARDMKRAKSEGEKKRKKTSDGSGREPRG